MAGLLLYQCCFCNTLMLNRINCIHARPCSCLLCDLVCALTPPNTGAASHRPATPSGQCTTLWACTRARQVRCSLCFSELVSESARFSVCCRPLPNQTPAAQCGRVTLTHPAEQGPRSSESAESRSLGMLKEPACRMCAQAASLCKPAPRRPPLLGCSRVALARLAQGGGAAGGAGRGAGPVPPAGCVLRRPHAHPGNVPAGATSLCLFGSTNRCCAFRVHCRTPTKRLPIAAAFPTLPKQHTNAPF